MDCASTMALVYFPLPCTQALPIEVEITARFSSRIGSFSTGLAVDRYARIPTSSKKEAAQVMRNIPGKV